VYSEVHYCFFFVFFLTTRVEELNFWCEILPRKLNTTSNHGKLNLNIGCNSNYTETREHITTWKTVKADKFFKIKFTISVTYILQQCSLHELQVKKGECSLLFKFGKGISFLKAQESSFNIGKIRLVSIIYGSVFSSYTKAILVKYKYSLYSK